MTAGRLVPGPGSEDSELASFFPHLLLSVGNGFQVRRQLLGDLARVRLRGTLGAGHVKFLEVLEEQIGLCENPKLTYGISQVKCL